MKKKVAVVGAGAIGGYLGGQLARNEFDVTLIDPWPMHVETIRRNGIHIEGMTPEEACAVNVAALHISDVQHLAREKPIDIALVSVKSYDTEWATTLIRPYLAPDGFVVSAQNGINEECIARVVGWGRTVGCIISRVSAELYAAGRLMRTSPLVGSEGHAFYVGETHGRVTHRVEELAQMIDVVDGCSVTTNLWGERWSKLCVNAMRNGVSAVTGLAGHERDRNATTRRFTVHLAGEAVRVGHALGYAFDRVATYDADRLARASEGDVAAFDEIDSQITAEARSGVRSDKQRPSMAQDIGKGRRTEIDDLNGLVAREAARMGLATPANAAITDAVRKLERSMIPAAPESLPSLR